MLSKFKAYVALIILLGMVFFLLTLNEVNNIDILGVLIFTLMSIVAESLVIVTLGQRALSVGFVISLSAILVFGAPEAAWICCIGVMLRIINHEGKLYHIFKNPIHLLYL
jgi:hypothetical protein